MLDIRQAYRYGEGSGGARESGGEEELGLHNVTVEKSEAVDLMEQVQDDVCQRVKDLESVPGK